MSSVRKLPNSRFWIGCYTDHTGKQRQRSTKRTNKVEALKIAEQYESAYLDIQTEAQARRVIANIYEEVHGKALASSTTRNFFTRWVKTKEIENARSTYLKYRGVKRRFLGFMGPKADKDLIFIDKGDIQAYRDHLLQSLSAGTAKDHVKILRGILEDAWRDNLIQDNPAKKVRALTGKAAAASRRPFTLNELKRVLAVADCEWSGMLLTGLYTGQRLGDIARLTWAAIDLQEEVIALNTGKTGRRVILPIAGPLLNHLIDLPASDNPTAPLFPKADAIVGKYGNVSKLSQQFNKLLAVAGLVSPRKKKNTGRGNSVARESQGISFHALRHTATSLLKNAGIGEAVAMDIIGHESKEISRSYTHIETSAKRKALDSMPDITRG